MGEVTSDPHQLRLDDVARSVPAGARVSTSHYKDTIESHFWEFHKAHPEVYDEIVQLARQWRARGDRAKWSIDGAFEVIRWQRRINADAREQYKLNNNYRSRYARLVMDREDDLDGIFETREIRSA